MTDPPNKRTGQDCAPAGPDETQRSRHHLTQGVGQRAQAEIADAIARSTTALRSLQAIQDGTKQATTHDLEAARALFAGAVSKLNVAIEDAFMIDRRQL